MGKKYGTYKELGRKQQDVTDILSNCWLPDVHIHAAGILFKKQYPNYPMQLDTHRCKANIMHVITKFKFIMMKWTIGCYNQISLTQFWYMIVLIKLRTRKKWKICEFFLQEFCSWQWISDKISRCNEKVGSNNCGLFCIAYAVDLADDNDPSDIEYDQSCMRWHLVECFKKGKLALFPRNSRNLNSRRDTNPGL